MRNHFNEITFYFHLNLDASLCVRVCVCKSQIVIGDCLDVISLNAARHQ